MRYGYWVNHGREYTLVNERGAVEGVLKTWDDRIAARIQKSYYGPPSKSEREVGGRIRTEMPNLKVS